MSTPSVDCPRPKRKPKERKLAGWLQPMIDQLGPIPHASLLWRGDAPRVKRGGGGVIPGDAEDGEPSSSRPKKQTTRLKKCECQECGYTVRITAKWLEIGPPHCPAHGAMEVEEQAELAA